MTESGIALDETVNVHKGKTGRKDLLKNELNGIAHYWRCKLELQRDPQKDSEFVSFEIEPPPRPGRKKIDHKGADHLFDYLIFELGKLWTDRNIFNQKKIGISIPSSGGKAGGPFIRFAYACCKALKIEKSTDAIAAVIKKDRGKFKELSQKTISTRQNERQKLLKSIDLKWPPQ